MNSPNYKEFLLERDPKVSGIRSGINQAQFMDVLWDRHPELKEFMFGDDVSKYMAGNLPDFNVGLDGLYLDKSAFHTDFISVGSLLRGYIVNSKVREILEAHHLPNHKFYEVVLYQIDKRTRNLSTIRDYWWFYFEMETGKQTVDFEQSEFDYSVHHQRYPNRTFSVKTYSDYKQVFDNTPPALKATKLVFNHNFNAELDFWGTQFLSVRDYVSERLLRKFELANVTGYRVKMPACQLVF